VTRGRELVEIDPATNRVRRQRALPGNPADLGAGGGNVWVSLADERIVRVDEGSARITATPQASAAGFSPVVTSRALWMILPSETPRVARFDPVTAREAASVSFTQGFPTAIAAGDGVIWGVDHVHGRLWRIDEQAPAADLVASVPYHPITIAARGGTVWVGVQRELYRFN
jgi:hypothetical protein